MEGLLSTGPTPSSFICLFTLLFDKFECNAIWFMTNGDGCELFPGFMTRGVGGYANFVLGPDKGVLDPSILGQTNSNKKYKFKKSSY